MKVKIGNKIYDANDQPIMLILSEHDKFNLSHMEKKATKYCCFPTGSNKDDIIKFMEDEKK